MNKKKISFVITEKLNSWIKTLPEDLRKEVEENIFVSGGCIASMLLNEPVNDYDVYFTNSKVLKKVVDHYLKALPSKTNKRVGEINSLDHGNSVEIVIKSQGVASGDGDEISEYEYFENADEHTVTSFVEKLIVSDKKLHSYKPLLFTSNAISLSNDIQIITRFCGSSEEVHKNFDFIHATNTFSLTEGLKLRPEAVECILMKELRYNGSLYPVAALFRLRKFIQRGWKVNAGQMFKIAYDIAQLDLNDIMILRDQLIGVDVAYFHEVLEKLQHSETSEQIDRTYLFSVLNNIFDGEE